MNRIILRIYNLCYLKEVNYTKYRKLWESGNSNISVWSLAGIGPKKLSSPTIIRLYSRFTYRFGHKCVDVYAFFICQYLKEMDLNPIKSPWPDLDPK